MVLVVFVALAKTEIISLIQQYKQKGNYAYGCLRSKGKIHLSHLTQNSPKTTTLAEKRSLDLYSLDHACEPYLDRDEFWKRSYILFSCGHVQEECQNR